MHPCRVGREARGTKRQARVLRSSAYNLPGAGMNKENSNGDRILSGLHNHPARAFPGCATSVVLQSRDEKTLVRRIDTGSPPPGAEPGRSLCRTSLPY